MNTNFSTAAGPHHNQSHRNLLSTEFVEARFSRGFPHNQSHRLESHFHIADAVVEKNIDLFFGFVTVRLFKSSLKKDRAILSETSGQRKLVCWC